MILHLPSTPCLCSEDKKTSKLTHLLSRPLRIPTPVTPAPLPQSMSTMRASRAVHRRTNAPSTSMARPGCHQGWASNCRRPRAQYRGPVEGRSGCQESRRCQPATSRPGPALCGMLADSQVGQPPKGGPDTGGGSTAGIDEPVILAAGGGLLVAAGAAFAISRKKKTTPETPLEVWSA